MKLRYSLCITFFSATQNSLNYNYPYIIENISDASIGGGSRDQFGGDFRSGKFIYEINDTKYYHDNMIK